MLHTKFQITAIPSGLLTTYHNLIQAMADQEKMVLNGPARKAFAQQPTREPNCLSGVEIQSAQSLNIQQKKETTVVFCVLNC